MNNQERKLFNIACKVEKLLYEYCGIEFFSKEMFWNKVIINSGNKELEWSFLEPFTDLTKKEDMNFSIFATEENKYLQIKIWL